MTSHGFSMPPLPDGADLDPTARGVFRVLVAEDHAVNQKFLAIVLNSFGVSFVMTSDGAKALAHAQDERYDMLLFDYRMPVMSGLEALQGIRATSSPNAQTPAVALTADCSDATCRRLVAGGFDAVIAKPFSPIELARAMHEAIASRVPRVVASPGNSAITPANAIEPNEATNDEDYSVSQFCSVKENHVHFDDARCAQASTGDR